MGGGATKPKKGAAGPSASQQAPIKPDRSRYPPLPPANDRLNNSAESTQGRVQTQPINEVQRRSVAKVTAHGSPPARGAIADPLPPKNDRGGVPPRYTSVSSTKDSPLPTLAKRSSAGTMSDGGTRETSCRHVDFHFSCNRQKFSGVSLG